MGFSKEWVGFVLVLWGCHLLGLVFGTESFLEKVSDLQCTSSKMYFSLPTVLLEFTSAVFVLGHDGKLRELHNDSACGLWVGKKPDGSVVIGASYDGCYVREENGDHVMTLIAEQISNGQVEHHKRDIQCPFMPALDAPSPSDCVAIQRTDRLPCANSSVSRDVCEAQGCCFTPNDFSLPCYYGNKITAQCTDGSQVLIAISKDLTKPSLIMDSARVLNVNSTSCPSLKVSKTFAFILFQFPLSCGRSSQVSENSMLYENTVYAMKDIRSLQGSSITRDSSLRFTVRCSYSKTGVVPLLQVEVNTLPPPLPVSTSGPLLLEMRIARDAQYTSYYADTEYPVIKVLRDPVFLEVRILQKTDPNLVLILNDCWATPSPGSTQQVQWPVLLARCPFPGDNYITQLVPVGAPTQNMPLPTHYQRFIVSTFTFVDQSTETALGGLVYFQCSASVCIPSATDPCRTSCGQKKKRAAQKPAEMTISKGPVEFIDGERPTNQTVMSSQDFSAIELLNETSEQGFIGAKNEGPLSTDGDFSDVDQDIPLRVGGTADTSDPNSPTLMWLRGAAAGGGVLLVLITIMGVHWHKRNHSNTMYTVKI